MPSLDTRPVTFAEIMCAHSRWKLTGGQQGQRARLPKTLAPGQTLCSKDLSFVDFGDLDLSSYTLKNSNLSYSDLSKVTGLTENKLAGANLCGALLPPYIDFTSISQIADSSKAANGMLVTFLIASLFTILTVFQTTDAALFVNSGGAKIPVVQTDLPVTYFYVLTPFLLLSLYVHLNINISRLWVLISSLPEVFPDGRPVHERIYPWFFSGLYFLFSRPRYHKKPTFHTSQGVMSAAGLLIIFPIFLIILFIRYLAMQNWMGVIFLSIASSLALIYAVWFFLNSVSTFSPGAPTGTPSGGSRLRALLTTTRGGIVCASLIFAAHCVVAWLAIYGQPPDPKSRWAVSFIPKLLIAARLPPFANLTGAELVRKPSGWTSLNEPSDALLATVPRISLTSSRLRHADGKGMFAANADFADSVFSGGSFDFAELHAAKLSRSNLSNASFFGAKMYRADLDSAIVDHANFRESVLTQGNLANAKVSSSTFDKALLTGAHFSLASLVSTTFRFAKMESADFNSAIIDGVMFNAASMANAKFRTAKLSAVSFQKAELTNADFSQATLHNVNFAGSNMVGAKIAAEQLSTSCGDAETKLPVDLQMKLRPCQ